MRTLNEQIQRLRDRLHTCYESIARKGGTLPPIGERNMTNLPDAVESVPQVVDAKLEELNITENGEYTPQDGVNGFSKVVAEFDMSILPKVKVSSFMVNSGCIDADGYWAGEILLDTSECTSFSSSFSYCSAVKFMNGNGFNTSKVTNFTNAFLGCGALQRISTSNWDVSAVTTFQNIFNQCASLEMLDLTNWDVSNANNFSSAFFRCYVLSSLIDGKSIEDVLNRGISCLNGLKVSIDFATTILDRASLRAVINGLADLTGQTAQTLTLGTTLIAKLTEEDIAIAVNKNWTIS